MELKNKTTRKPKIVVAQSDYQRLSSLAEAASGHNPEVSEQLLSELDRATIRPDEQVGTDVIRMGSTAEYSTETGEARKVTLVFPGSADISEGKISILTPIGVALLGLAPGQSIDWTARDGRRHRLMVTRVEQGESAQTA
ncbi:regulator of nucleoside diphosphate kinase [Mesorhizobium sp. J18]|uniref:nucleoside diphosphate kinase regulator n=1 Tax=Mesorhizobium sp. J18 TaxID=935263 RepID=UPI00119C0222|nr:nucleoside diphosphate kinase regulator [Mesorhizobium sp. J18]TWH00104.1 regulator of nucleoside diphosphate kinase [Mesorhizobium sp. J18]